MSIATPECIICAWRATCNLKFKYEGGSSLSCPEFTRDISIGKDDEIASPEPALSDKNEIASASPRNDKSEGARNDIPPAKKPESKK